MLAINRGFVEGGSPTRVERPGRTREKGALYFISGAREAYARWG